MEIIVDLFNQHSSQLDELKKMAMSAWLSGADVVKIQLLNSERIWGNNSRSYMEMTHLDFLNFHNFCESNEIPMMATVFDEEKLNWLDEVGITRYKIASVTTANEPELCEKILQRGLPTIVSTGLQPEDNPFPYHVFGNGHVSYLWCVAKYPTYLWDKKLKDMPHMFIHRGWKGFSDHVVGIAAALEAYRRGADILEKHYTHNIHAQNEFEKAHACSFTPETLRQFKNLIREWDVLTATPASLA